MKEMLGWSFDGALDPWSCFWESQFWKAFYNDASLVISHENLMSLYQPDLYLHSTKKVMDADLEAKISQLAERCYKDEDFLSADLVEYVQALEMLDKKFEFILMGYAQSLNEAKMYPTDFVSKIHDLLKIQKETQADMNATLYEDSGRG